MLLVVLSYYPKDTGELSTEYLDILNYSNKRDYEGSFQISWDTFALKLMALQRYYGRNEISSENIFENRDNYEDMFDNYFEGIVTVFEIGNRESLADELFAQ